MRWVERELWGYAVSLFHTQQFDECSCILPRQKLVWSGKCDSACFAVQDALTKQQLVMYPGQPVKELDY